MLCTHCGAPLLNRRTGEPVRELYDEELFAHTKILRLLDCRACCGADGPADEYVEQEGVVILTDLLLQTKQAYRHVLYNGAYTKLILKMTLLSVICDGYIDWAALPSAGEFFEQEYLFYEMCARVSVALLCFIIIGIISCRPKRENLGPTLVGLLMAYSARFCFLAATLWAPMTSESESHANGGSELMWILVYLVFYLATVRVLQTTQNRSLLSCVVVATLVHAGFNLVHRIDWILAPMSC